MRIYCNCYWTFPNDSSKHRKRIETGRQLWLTFKKISIYRRSWVLSFTSSLFFKSEYCQGNYFISLHCSLSFWKELTDPGPEGASERWLGTDATSCPHEFPVRLSQGSLFQYFLPQFLVLTHSLQHIKIGEKEKKTDSEEEAKISHLFDQF